MTYRPLVVPASVSIEVVLKSAGEEVYLTLDGQIGFPFRTDDRILIDRQSRPVRLVRVTGRNFFEVLRKKLRWGER
jgi:NAD+ kinase